MQDDDCDVDAGEKKPDDEMKRPAVDDAGKVGNSEFEILEKPEIDDEKKPPAVDDVGEKKLEDEMKRPAVDDAGKVDDSEFDFVNVEKPEIDDESCAGESSSKEESLLSYLVKAANLKYDELTENHPIITVTFKQMAKELGFPYSAYINLPKVYRKFTKLATKPKKEAWEKIKETALTVGAAAFAFGIICLIRRQFSLMEAVAYLFQRGFMKSPLMAGPKGTVESLAEEIKDTVKKWVKEAVPEKPTRKFSADDLTDEDILRIFERHAALTQPVDEDELEASRRSLKEIQINWNYIGSNTVVGDGANAERENLRHHSAGSTGRVFGLDSPSFSTRPRERELRTSNSAADESDLKEEQPSRQRLLVVANRLPVSAVRNGDDSWQLELNVGGLVSALLGVKEFDVRLFGWAGVNVPDTVGQNALTEALAEKRCIPVFLAEETVNKYNSSCNNILWPLFHHLGLPQDHLATTQSFQSQFDDYKKANQIFADVINKHYEDGDIVWCHSYHLMFLPKCLKEHNSKMRVGWTLHSPFPKSAIHWTLPYGSQLLRAVLAADLVGFHTYDCVRHFVWACTHALGLKGTPKGVENQGILTHVFAFPIGIDSDQFIRSLEDPHVQKYMRKLKERFAGRKVMLGVDRLDMIKGICQKMLAFEKFLEKNPDQRDKVVLLQIAVPTGTDVPEHEKLTSQVHEIVGRINGRFGTLTAVPIHHLDQSLDFHALCALYAVTDVALFTSLRDGVNLASYEFIACQASKKGVLILSEFAAAAQPFDAEAILVNPWDITEFAASLGNALNLPADDREKRHHCNVMHVTTHKYQEWAATFVSELNTAIAEAQARATQVPPLLTTKGLDGDLLKSSADVVTPLKELDEGGKHANPEPSNSEGGKQAIPEPSTSEGGALSLDSED